MKTVLVIEDDTDMREALKETFTHAGYAVTAVANSEEGLKVVAQATIDLIILDVMTYSLHGSAFLQRLRQLPEGQRDSKVIVLTNLDNDITRKKVAEYHIDGFMVKVDTSLEQLTAKAKELLGE